MVHWGEPRRIRRLSGAAKLHRNTQEHKPFQLHLRFSLLSKSAVHVWLCHSNSKQANHGPTLRPVILLGQRESRLQVASNCVLHPGTLDPRKHGVHGIWEHLTGKMPIPIGGTDDKGDHSSRCSEQCLLIEVSMLSLPHRGSQCLNGGILVLPGVGKCNFLRIERTPFRW